MLGLSMSDHFALMMRKLGSSHASQMPYRTIKDSYSVHNSRNLTLIVPVRLKTESQALSGDRPVIPLPPQLLPPLARQRASVGCRKASL